jgi:hypothetical protein
MMSVVVVAVVAVESNLQLVSQWEIVRCRIRVCSGGSFGKDVGVKVRIDISSNICLR